MEREKKFQLIIEKIIPNLTKFWVNEVTGELVFLDKIEVTRFKNRFKGRFKENFYHSIKIHPLDITTVPFSKWIDEFTFFQGEV